MGITDYATIERPMPSLTAFTICMWIRMDQTPKNQHALSYAVAQQDNEILMRIVGDKLFFYVDYKSSG